MEFLKKHKIKLIVGIVIVAVLAGAFYFGGNAPGSRGWSVDNSANTQAEQPEQETEPEVTTQEETKPAEPVTEPEEKPEEVQAEVPDETEPETKPEPEPQEEEVIEIVDPNGNVQEIDPETGMDQYNTDPVPEGMPVPVEPENAEYTGETGYCTISISCSTILDNMDFLEPEKVDLVPADGWILEPVTVSFSKGESVFDVLLRVVQSNNIHMEHSFTPMYNSVYVEGIGNLYEFDCGELSGWMYKVNSWFPNYGCSRYQLEDGDVICWVYTCDLGYDVGGGYAVG